MKKAKGRAPFISKARSKTRSGARNADQRNLLDSKSTKSKKTVAKKTAKKAVKKSAGKSTSRKTAAKKTTSKKTVGSHSFERLLETRGTVTEELSSVRFAGVSLGGGKTDKTAVAVIEYFPEQKRVFLRSLREKVSSMGEISADQNLLQILNEEEGYLSCIAFDVPLQFPTCVRCDLVCPGVESCEHPEMKWMRAMHKKRDKLKRPNKMFTPYTERAVEIYIAHELEEPFHPPQALGSNAAPLAARAHYLRKLLRFPLMEVFPKLSLWRIGQALDIPKSYLRFHRHAVDSDEARHYILKTLIEKELAFIYQQDLRAMVENSVVFDAFISALTAFLKHRGQTEKPPADFPKGESWIDFPREKIVWF